MFPGKWIASRAGDLATSLRFLTRLPMPLSSTGGELARTAWAWPIAGIVVGLIGAVVYAVALKAGLPGMLAAPLAVAATLVTTGCLHEDGLADTADGFGGGKTPEQKLAIMRDSRIGTYGVCALVMSLLLRILAVAYLDRPAAVALALVAAHGAARAAMAAVMYLLPTARENGLSFGAGRPLLESVLASAAIGIVVLALCLGFGHAIVAIVLLCGIAAVFAWLSLRQIGGQSGDVLGAIEQVGEIAILLVALH